VIALSSLQDLALFMAQVLVLALYGLTVSGHFPAEFRAPSLRGATGALLLWGTIALAATASVLLVVFAWRRVELPFAVIGGGAMLLAAPLLLRPFPDSFVNGRRGLVTFAGLAAALSAMVAWLLR
jgi:hypothetical protein